MSSAWEDLGQRLCIPLFKTVCHCRQFGLNRCPILRLQSSQIWCQTEDCRLLYHFIPFFRDLMDQHRTPAALTRLRGGKGCVQKSTSGFGSGNSRHLDRRQENSGADDFTFSSPAVSTGIGCELTTRVFSGQMCLAPPSPGNSCRQRELLGCRLVGCIILRILRSPRIGRMYRYVASIR